MTTHSSDRSAVIDIAGVDAEGDGIGRLGERTIAVAGVVPGEQVEIRVRDAPRGQGHADLLRVVRPSAHRVEPRCRHAAVCGGCAWQHIAYGEQLRLKQSRLQRLLSASLGADAPGIDPMVGMAPPEADGAPRPGCDPQAPWYFRNKVSFVFGPGHRGQPLAMGHYQQGSKIVVPVEECPVHAEAGNALAFRTRDALLAARVPAASEDGQRGLARHVVVRVSHNRSESLVTLVVTANDKSLRGAVRQILDGADPPDGFHLNVHDRPGPSLFGASTRKLHGRDRLREEIAGVSFLVSPTAFFQTNVQAAGVLLEMVSGAIADGRSWRVLDLYAGAGLFALPLARWGHLVTAVEESAESIADGEASRWFSKIPEEACRFVRGRVEELIGSRPGGLAGAQRPDAVILDPPRAGCPARVLGAIVRGVRPARIVYVSCNPDMLARDLAMAVAGGYRVDRVRPVDMFPHTAHIEAVAVLSPAR
jgi:23S rRNA (uracil1939-C5)-methyltransferase